MSEQAVVAVPSPEEEGKDVDQLYGELLADVKMVKKRPPQDYQAFWFWFKGSMLPAMVDIAFLTKSNADDIETLMHTIDTDEETQFTVEDAKKFDVVLQFALGVAKEMLANELSNEKAQQISVMAEECLQIIEKSTLEEPEAEEEPPT